MRSPKRSYAHSSTSSADKDSRSGGSRLAVAKQHLLQRVAAQAETQRLERNHLVRRDVPEVDLGAELLDEPGLRTLGGRLEDDVGGIDGVGDLRDQLGPHAAARVEDPGRSAFARLRDHLPRAGVELLA